VQQAVELVTRELFDDWASHPVTQRLMKRLLADREMMKEGLVNNAWTDEAEVKGRCRAIAVLLNLEYEDLMVRVERGELND